MDFYELMEILIEGHTWNNEQRKADALGVVRELKAMNAFGTLTGTVAVTKHDHVMVWQYTNGTKWQECSYCHEKTEPEFHNGTTWSRYR